MASRVTTSWCFTSASETSRSTSSSKRKRPAPLQPIDDLVDALAQRHPVDHHVVGDLGPGLLQDVGERLDQLPDRMFRQLALARRPIQLGCPGRTRCAPRWAARPAARPRPCTSGTPAGAGSALRGGRPPPPRPRPAPPAARGWAPARAPSGRPASPPSPGTRPRSPPTSPASSPGTARYFSVTKAIGISRMFSSCVLHRCSSRSSGPSNSGSSIR